MSHYRTLLPTFHCDDVQFVNKDIFLCTLVFVEFYSVVNPHYSKMSGSENELEAGVSGYTRKRSRNEEKWEKTKAKYARNKGEAYTSYTTKQQVAARAVGPACKCGCFDKVGMDSINELFNKFWEMGDFNHQNAYISKMVTSMEVKRCRVKRDRTSRQKRRIVYKVINNNTVHSICRNAFYSIHGITEKRVRTALEKVSLTGMTEPDMRGRTIPTTKITHEQRQSVINHIASVPISLTHTSPQTALLNGSGINSNEKTGDSSPTPDGKTSQDSETDEDSQVTDNPEDFIKRESSSSDSEELHSVSVKGKCMKSEGNVDEYVVSKDWEFVEVKEEPNIFRNKFYEEEGRTLGQGLGTRHLEELDQLLPHHFQLVLPGIDSKNETVTETDSIYSHY
ncbi:uncharacterized protein LOC143035331 isoform X3 [Oratosquilla oratoria]|uniref:uncharacterized protein LOC143035331 isoform X3 n=1 Tax=Oratosquilla oratoria TaxID=337810 RepID=UPI003F764A80